MDLAGVLVCADVCLYRGFRSETRRLDAAASSNVMLRPRNMKTVGDRRYKNSRLSPAKFGPVDMSLFWGQGSGVQFHHLIWA